MKANIFNPGLQLAAALLLTAGAVQPGYAGSVARLFYDGISSSSDSTAVRQSVQTLKTNAIFPSAPTFREQLDDFQLSPLGEPVFGLQGKDNSGIDLGSWVRGYLEAPQTGGYLFFIASDDNSELWLSTDLTTNSLVRIASESKYGAPLFSGARLNERQSAPVSLTRGQKYYFEVYHKQSAGAAYLQVGWQRPDSVQEIIPARHLAQHPLDPYLGRTDANAPPFFNPAGWNGGDLPATISLNEGDPLVLPVDVIAAQPTTFEWRRNGAVIPGENLSYLALPSVSAVANGEVLQVLISNPFGGLTSAAATLAITPDTTPPTVELVEARGNPNGLRVTFSERVNPASATSLANYSLQRQGGASLAIQAAELLADQRSVQLSGAFNFQAGASYQLTVANVSDQAYVPNGLAPNPTVAPFTYQAPLGTLYDFNTDQTNDFTLFGAAALRTWGSYDGSGYLKLTDGVAGERGALQFRARRAVDQFRLRFKTRLADASVTPGDGFSVTLAADLPSGTFLDSQAGYLPPTALEADRFIVAFDNARTVGGARAPAISVKWRGATLTNVLTGVNGIPALHSTDGHWANVDINLQRGGLLTVAYDGVTILNRLVTGFEPVMDAQLELAAQTGTNFETHWFDDLNLNFAEGDLGPVGFSPASPLGNLTVVENRPAHLAVIPTGSSPFTYQWYHEGLPVAGATRSVLEVVANAATAGNYWVVVSNEFSQATSGTAQLTVLADTVPPRLLSARGIAGGLNQVRLTFDEPLDPVTATNLGTYELGFLSVAAAILSEDGRTVTLQTGWLQRDQVYVFKINGLKDRAVAGNTLSASAAFLAEVNYAAEVALDAPVRYWRFEEPSDSPAVASLTAVKDALTNAIGTPVNNPTLGVPGLVPSQPESPAVQLAAQNNQSIAVLNGADLNTTSGPWARKTVELWFRAASLPAPGTTGLAATAGLWEQGQTTRELALYLWRDPANANPDQAELVFHALNNASDGAGSPFGASVNLTTPAVFVQHTIKAGEVYHVVAVFDGDPAGTSGALILYVNGVEAGRVGGVGQLYNHTGDVQIGRGNGLIHTGQNGNLGFFDGVIDELSLYNTALPANRVAAHYQAGALAPLSGPNTLAVTQVDTHGNPNGLLLTFNQPVAAASATNLANFALRTALGASIPIQSARLLAGERTVELRGSFNFQVGGNYVLNLANITDQAVPANPLAANPTNVAFSFNAPAGTTYTFNAGLPGGVQLFGNGGIVAGGSYDGSGYLRLTDAAPNQNGAVLFTERHDVDQVHLRFKARLADSSATPADGFSVTLAADLPRGTFGTAEEGYGPAASPNADRLVVAFDNYQNNSGDLSPSIAVKWRGVVLTNVLTGTNGIPALSSTDGHWADVDLQLKRGGTLTLRYDGVTVIDQLATGFESLASAQVALGARTGGSYETHWFDDIQLNFADGDIGPVTIPANGQPQGAVVLENQLVPLIVAPVGAGPFGYQWYYNNAPLAGATGRALPLTASKTNGGAYQVVVWNEFSAVTSAVAQVTVQTDVTPPVIQQVQALGGTLNQARLLFDKPLDPASATNLANYAAGSLPILGATLSTNGLQLTLLTGPQQYASTYVLTLTGLRDRAAIPNTLNTQVTFQTAVSYSEEILADAPVRYWHFDETNGVTAYSQTSVLDTLVTAQGTYVNSPVLGVPTLVSNLAGATAVQLNAAVSNRVNIPNGSDINTTVGPWAQKTVEFWFQAASLPRGGVSPQAPIIYKEGGGNRGLGVYLYGTEDSVAPATAQLVWQAYNNKSEGAGSPWGTTNGHPELSVFVSAPVTTNQVYHVVAVLDGDTNRTGQLLLYTNGVIVGNVSGAGRIWNHSGNAPRVGNGDGLLRHDGVVVSTNDYFNGVIDELVLFNQALTPARVTAHYQAGQTPPLRPTLVTPPAFTSYRTVNNTIVVSWAGAATLLRATHPAGPFTPVPAATSPYQEPLTNFVSGVFYRLIQSQ